MLLMNSKGYMKIKGREYNIIGKCEETKKSEREKKLKM